MTPKGNGRKAGGCAPALFPFITLRWESFGALLFNPFLAAEKEFDQAGALVVGLCDGSHTREEMIAACMRSLAMSEAAAAGHVDSIMAELQSLCAVDPCGSATGRPGRAETVLDGAPLSAPKSVIWDVTYACNLTCPHCLTASGGRADGELDTADAFRLVDILAEARVLYLSLAGGEPLLRKDIIPLLEHIAETGMRVDIATNGFALPQRIVDALRELPVFHVQVSIDGIGPEHDAFRGRRGAFDRACDSLRRLKEAGLATSISTTATARNIHQLGDIADLAVALGCDAYKAIPFIPAGRGKANEEALRLDCHGSMELSRALTAIARKHADRLNVIMDSTFGFLMEPPAPADGAEGAMMCSAGYDTLSVGADGTVYPCPFLHAVPLGNLLRDPLDRIWHQSPLLEGMRTLGKEAMSGPCGSCEYAPAHCRGGCRASAYISSGSLSGSDPLCFKSLVQSTSHA